MIKRLRVTVDGTSFDVTVELPEDSLQAGSPAPVPISAPPPATPAAPAAEKPEPSLPAPAAPGPAAPGGHGAVPSPMSGRVTAVAVQLGQEVKEGTHLVTLEAMKMNTFVFAPKDGKVTALNAGVGAVVDEGQTLVTIE
jgi:biotin carboxyl carrier protein